MSVLKVNNITNRDGLAGPTVAGIASVVSNSHFVVPTGRTGQRYADDGENIVRNGLVLYLDAKYSLPSPVGLATTSASHPDYPFTWYDMSGNGNDGELVNGVGIATSNGGALSFDGSNDYVSIGYGKDLSSSQISVSIWFNVTQIPTSGNVGKLIRNRTYGWETLINPNGEINANLWISDSSNPSVISTGISTVTVNNWYNSTFTFGTSPTSPSSGELKLYVNGTTAGITTSSVTTNDDTIFYNNTNMFVAIGRDADASNSYFNGKIAIVQIYNRKLSDAEVLQNYNALKGRFGLS